MLQQVHNLHNAYTKMSAHSLMIFRADSPPWGVSLPAPPPPPPGTKSPPPPKVRIMAQANDMGRGGGGASGPVCRLIHAEAIGLVSIRTTTRTRINPLGPNTPIPPYAHQAQSTGEGTGDVGEEPRHFWALVHHNLGETSNGTFEMNASNSVNGLWPIAPP